LGNVEPKPLRKVNGRKHWEMPARLDLVADKLRLAVSANKVLYYAEVDIVDK